MKYPDYPSTVKLEGFREEILTADLESLLKERARLAEENERLRALLEKLATYDKRLHWETIEEIKAALAGREEGK